ncbi:MAG: GLUG motif-containing protein, partial [Pseudomonadota bacterium]|nr:GLUG motif-containing protein [Pseudomonadota bacterium]
MNKIYRLIWNEITCTWVAVSELTKGRGKRASGAVMLAAAGIVLALPAAPALAAPPNPPATNQLPSGGQVVAGAASVSQSAAVMNINQSTNSAAIDWQTFNVGSQAQVNFNQPSSSSVTLNRVLDSNPSQIFGRITANGQVFLTSPGGVYFAPGASVDVGGLVATTHSISNADFMAGNYNFTRNGATGSIVNEGGLSAILGGYIALLAPEVRNHGIVIAQMGTVALAAGEAYELQFDGNNTLANIRVEPSTINALVENGNAVQAPGGLIILSAQAVDKLQGGGIINNSGALEATGLVNDGGRIMLEASHSISHTGSIKADAAAESAGQGGTVTLIANLADPDSLTTVNGSISARGGDLGGDGGFIETSGGRVKIGDSTRVDTRAPQGKTGTWLIDPDGFTIAASGGDISGATLSANLGSADVSILSVNGGGSDGNVNVNDAVTWSINKLTLTATNDVNINAVMTANNTASLDLEPASGKVNVGLNGNFKGRVDFFQADGTTARSGTGFLTIGGVGYTVITDLGAEGSITGTDLQGMNGNKAGKYALGSNIDAAATSGWNAGTGFLSVGDGGSRYTGTFDGLGHTISNLTINRPTTDFVGLFGYSNSTATARNVGLIDASVTGQNYVGALIAVNNGGGGGSISNSYATGTISGTNYVGGLMGIIANDKSMSNSYATTVVSGSSRVGGLVGATLNLEGAISNSYATGNVTGGVSSEFVGGLIGRVEKGGVISNNYATGTVSGTDFVGGLIGESLGGSINNGYATGAVSGSSYVGGLVGRNIGVTGGDGYGSTGANGSAGTVNNSYATGAVTGSSNVGGLVGGNIAGNGGYGETDSSNNLGIGGNGGSATINTSYAMGAVTGGSSVGGLVGKNTGGDDGSAYSGGIGGIGGAATASASYWNTTTSGRASSAGGGGLTSTQAKTASNFTGFTFTTTPGATGNNWVMVDVDGTLNNAGGAVGATGPMLASEYSTDILNAHQLQLMAMAPAANYTLSANINAAATGNSSGVWGSAGFVSIGNAGANFTGTLDGLGYTISNLTVSANNQAGGLFGSVSYATIQNLNLNNVTISALPAGALAGNVDNSTITNVTASNISVKHLGSDPWGAKGGLIGNATNSTLSQLHVTGTSALNQGTTGNTGWLTGGLVGLLSASTLDSSSSNATIYNGGIHVGGLVARSSNSTVSNSTATGNVTAAMYGIGGLIGRQQYGSSTLNSSATGNVVGGRDVGGLVGSGNSTSGLIDGSFATGTVTGGTYSSRANTGGLVGTFKGTISNAYASGNVSGDSAVGGLVGFSSGAISNSYSNASNITGTSAVGGLVGNNDTAGSITGSQVTGTGTVTASGDYSGGLVGQNLGSIASSTVASGSTVTGANNVGGLVGVNGGFTNSSATISLSTSAASVSLPDTGTLAGGLVGRNFGVITDSNSTGLLTAGINTFGLGGLTGISSGTISNAATNGSSVVAGAGADVVGTIVGVLSGTENGSLSTGTVMIGGAPVSPPLRIGLSYTDGIISTAGQLNYIQYFPNKDFSLANNLDMTGIDFKPITYGLGTAPGSGVSVPVFDGLGYTISNLTISANNQTGGLFGSVSYATIQNLNLDNIAISALPAGALAGNVDNSTITNVTASNISVKHLGSDPWGAKGGLIGNATNSTLSQLHVTGISALNQGTTGNTGWLTGGLVGLLSSSRLESSSSIASIYNGGVDVGGLVARSSSSTVSNSTATGNVTAAMYGIGGLIGRQQYGSSTLNSSATGNVVGGRDVGG